MPNKPTGYFAFHLDGAVFAYGLFVVYTMSIVLLLVDSLLFSGYFDSAFLIVQVYFGFLLFLGLLLYLPMEASLWRHREDPYVKALRLRAYTKARRWEFVIVFLFFMFSVSSELLVVAPPQYRSPVAISSATSGMFLAAVVLVVGMNFALFSSNIVVDGVRHPHRPKYSFSEELLVTLGGLVRHPKAGGSDVSLLLVEAHIILLDRLRKSSPNLRFHRLDQDFVLMKQCLRSGTAEEREILGKTLVTLSRFFVWVPPRVSKPSHFDEILKELENVRGWLARWEGVRVSNEIEGDWRTGLSATFESHQGLLLVILTTLLVLLTAVSFLLPILAIH